MMEKIAGRTYVSILIISSALKGASRAMDGNTWMWIFVIVNLFCLFFVVKDGVR